LRSSRSTARTARRGTAKANPIPSMPMPRPAPRWPAMGRQLPKDQHTIALRALLTARRGAVKARTAAINQIKALLIVAPAQLRERYRRHTTTTLVRAPARCRPGAHDDATAVAVLTGCKALAQRIEFLEHQTKDLTTALDELVAELNPAPRAAHGVAIPASSGKTTR
jgi:transposase